MSLEQQSARIIEAPAPGWVVWLSLEAYNFIQQMLESVADDADEDMDARKLANEILEGIF